jgi:ring-1,2-phenylacetyl-CoA epoxidase subunit PaaD
VSNGLAAAVRAAVALVDDPEYPGVSIVDLGILEHVRATGTSGAVEIDLVPTVVACPAFRMIEEDVRRAALAVPGVATVAVNRLLGVPWTTARVTEAGRRALATSFFVAVETPSVPVRCPVCQSSAVVERSAFGGSRCRSVHWCTDCRNTVEVVRA